MAIIKDFLRLSMTADDRQSHDYEITGPSLDTSHTNVSTHAQHHSKLSPPVQTQHSWQKPLSLFFSFSSCSTPPPLLSLGCQDHRERGAAGAAECVWWTGRGRLWRAQSSPWRHPLRDGISFHLASLSHSPILSPILCLAVCLSLCLSVCLSVCLPISVCLSLSLSLSLLVV